MYVDKITDRKTKLLSNLSEYLPLVPVLTIFRKPRVAVYRGLAPQSMGAESNWRLATQAPPCWKARNVGYCIRPLFHVTVSEVSSYQNPSPEDFNADAKFHVSVSVKPIFIFLHFFLLPTSKFYHLKGNATLFYPKWGNKLTFLSLIRVPMQGCDVLDTDYGFDILRENNCDFAN